MLMVHDESGRYGHVRKLGGTRRVALLRRLLHYARDGLQDVSNDSALKGQRAASKPTVDVPARELSLAAAPDREPREGTRVARGPSVPHPQQPRRSS